MIAMNPPKRPNLIKASVAACLLSALAPLSSCVVTVVEKLPPDASPRAVHEKARWDVTVDGARVGSLELLEIADPDDPVVLYRVCYPDGQQAGWIDMLGRAFREKRIEETGPDGLRHIGMNTMQESLRRLLELSTAPIVMPATEDDTVASR